MISIGSIFRGPELKGSEINRAIMAVSKALTELRPPLETTPWVNAVFIVPGSFGDVEFTEMEYGKFSKKNRAVVVQIPVPKAIVEQGDRYRFLIDCLHKANAMACTYLGKKGVVFPLAEADILVGKVAGRLGVLLT